MISLVLAILLDTLIGDPYNFPHPVRLMGKIISKEEKLFRRIAKTDQQLKYYGLLIVVINIAFTILVTTTLLNISKGNKILYSAINTYLIYTCIAARCLGDEAIKVSKALDKGIDEGRTRLSYIVGRDTKNLSELDVIKATVETVAENTSDGVIAPILYIMIFGATGGMVYKFVNTMDSMLGYMNDKYINLGYFPAKVDDLFNIIPSRLTAILMNISSLGRFDSIAGFKIMKRDGRNHKSPNSGYPESAVAGLLGIQLGGSNYYHGILVEKPTIGDKNNPIKNTHIYYTIEIMYRSLILILFIYFIVVYF